MIQNYDTESLPELYPKFLEFSQQLFQSKANGGIELNQAKNALAIICPYLKIGKIEMCPEHDLQVGRITACQEDKCLLYQNGIVDYEIPYQKVMKADPHQTVTFSFFPVYGEHIKKENEFWLNLMAQNLFMFRERTKNRNQLKKSLSTDTLTGLPNLNAFFSFGDDLIKRKIIFQYDAVLFNIKNFNYINQIVMHQKADAVMVRYSKRISSFTQKDEIIARMGGDNFIALIEKDRIKNFLEMLKEVKVEISIGSSTTTIALGSNCGIYEIDEPIQYTNEVMMPVAVALQKAKENVYEDCVVFSKELHKNVMQEKKILFNFPTSLEKGEFVPFLQPKINLKDGSLVGAEALARWVKKGNIVLPNDFIPVLEKDGAICQMDFEILRNVCKLIAGWKEKGMTPVPVSVNISGKQLKNPYFVEIVAGIVSEFKVEPQYIGIEITESANDQDHARLIKVFEDLKNRGFSTVIDGFGSRYSPISILTKLKLDVLKLDRSFITKISDSNDMKREQTFIRNIIRMAEEMNVQVLSEGVETIRQRDFVLENGCLTVQGFLYGKPLRAEEFERRAFS